ncbi:molybdate ABC transporter permease subunit [Methylovorus glucosotrophus]|uniref:Molybdenum transport system permease n=1 Tax=Methylovorus glucosotrophus (strain SIP3-4) TaxID=582744 RepID=C6XA26_METGS|nr:molybdate ABC transporter permease subunit [Methylovorus glucosotrophus]ACT51567.1 molybdate ABC transporter, inner membrane subunit [Methylovorus glucosotrophus SIP3-4]
MSILQLTPEEIAALWLSAKVAFFCTLLILIPGVLLGWVLARKRFFGKALLDSVVHLPLVLPPVVPGFLLLLLFGSQGFLGKWLQETFGISIAFTWMGAVVASAIMALPLMVRSARLAVSQVDRGLELAAQSLGAHPLRVFFSITLPLALPGILTGMVLAFSRSLGEFGATITFVGNIEGETRTLPLAIYTYTQIPGGDIPALRLVLLSLLLAFAALYFSNVMEQRALRRIGSGDDRA